MECTDSGIKKTEVNSFWIKQKDGRRYRQKKVLLWSKFLKKGHKLALICRPANCNNNEPIKNEVKVDLILSNDYADGNENGKKAIGVDQQNNYSARASRFSVHFFAVTARLRRENG